MASVRHQKEFLNTVLFCFVSYLNNLWGPIFNCCSMPAALSLKCQSDLHLTWVWFQPMPTAALVHCSALLGREGDISRWGRRRELTTSSFPPASRLALKNLNFRASPAQALQTETGSWREREQVRSLWLTLQIKHPILLFYYFDVVWYHMYNHGTKLYWVINHVAILPVSALQEMDFYLQEFKN